MQDFFKNTKDLRFLDFVIGSGLGYTFHKTPGMLGHYQDTCGPDIPLGEMLDYEYYWVPEANKGDIAYASGVRRYHSSLDQLKNVKDLLNTKEVFSFIEFLKDIINSRIPNFGHRWSMVCYVGLFDFANASAADQTRALAYTMWCRRQDNLVKLRELALSVMKNTRI